MARREVAVGFAVFEGNHHQNLVGGLDHWCCVGAKEHFRLEADMPEIRGWEVCRARLVVVVVVEMGETGGHRRVDGVGIGSLCLRWVQWMVVMSICWA